MRAIHTRRAEIARLRKAGEMPATPTFHLEAKRDAGEITDEDRARISARFGSDAAAGRVLRFTLSTPGRKADGIKLGRWQTARHEANPIVLWQHARWSPRIADSVTWLDDDSADEQTLRGVAAFYPRDLHPLSWQLGEMFAARGGAASVGFWLLDWQWADEDPDQSKDEEVGLWDINCKEQDLLEWSLVNVPMDERALVEARAAGGDTQPIADAIAELLERYPRADLERAWAAAAGDKRPRYWVPHAQQSAQLPAVGQDELRAALSRCLEG